MCFCDCDVFASCSFPAVAKLAEMGEVAPPNGAQWVGPRKTYIKANILGIKESLDSQIRRGMQTPKFSSLKKLLSAEPSTPPPIAHSHNDNAHSHNHPHSHGEDEDQ